MILTNLPFGLLGLSGSRTAARLDEKRFRVRRRDGLMANHIVSGHDHLDKGPLGAWSARVTVVRSGDQEGWCRPTFAIRSASTPMSLPMWRKRIPEDRGSYNALSRFDPESIDISASKGHALLVALRSTVHSVSKNRIKDPRLLRSWTAPW